MRPYILAESNWDYIKEAEFELAVLPWGATEAHNYHLPYSSDIIESDLIAAESAGIAWDKGGKVIVLPAVPFGVNTGQKDIFLDINLNPSTQFAILHDIVEVLNRQGLYKLLIFNSHGGNDFKPMIRELGLKFPEMYICTLNWYQSVDRYDYFENSGDHAEEMETSLLLYLKPELVLPKEKWGKGKEKRNKIKAFNEGWAWAERKWSKITEDTGAGNPELATKEKGESYFKAVTQKTGEFIYDLCKADVGDLYE
ncbi:MAG: creatininase family protein [Bacteroidales bacterium]|nr:creatininase family protein [Bacteroidales bacterium]